MPNYNIEAYIKSVDTVEIITPEEEYSLFEKYQATGDESHLEKIFNSYIKFVIFYLRIKKITMNDDIIQEAAKYMYAGIKNFDHTLGYKLTTYIGHYIISAARKHIYKEADYYDKFIVCNADKDMDDFKGDDDVTELDSYVELHQCINKLTMTQRKIIIMLYFEEKTVMEAAHIMGVSHQSVSFTEQKALKSLRTLLPPSIKLIYRSIFKTKKKQ